MILNSTDAKNINSHERIGIKLKAAAIFTLLMVTSAVNSGCDLTDALLKGKYNTKSAIKQAEAKKQEILSEKDKLKPKFMFNDDEKYFKNYLDLKEEFFFLDKFAYINAAPISNFDIDKDGNFITYDKNTGILYTFNKFGNLIEKVKLNFGSESRILAPSNIVEDLDGNIIMTCSILGRFYRFSKNGALLCSNDISESEKNDIIKLNFATKRFSFDEYTIYADIRTAKVYFYMDGKKAFEYSYDQLSDEIYFYRGPAGGYFMIDSANNTILKIVPSFDEETKRPVKCQLLKYSGNKILQNTNGDMFILRKNARVIDKLNARGEAVSQYGVVKEGNVSINNIFPADFAIGPDDSVYILDDKNYKVNVYNKSGVFSFSFGSYGKRPGKFSMPVHIITDKLKRIIIFDGERNEAIVFGPNGEYIESYGDILGPNSLAHYGMYVDLHEKIHIFDFTGNAHYSIPYEFQFIKILNDFFAAKNNYPPNFATIDQAANFIFFDFNGQRNIVVSPMAHIKAARVPDEISSKKTEPKKIYIKSICDDGQGNVLGLGKDMPYIYKLNINGRIITKFKLPKQPQSYMNVCSDMFRNFYLLDRDEKRIVKFDEYGKYQNSYISAGVIAPPLKNPDILVLSKKTYSFLIENENKRCIVFSTLNENFTVDSVINLAESATLGNFYVIDARVIDNNFFVLASSNDNLCMFKYKVIDRYKNAVQLFSQGLFQEALVEFEKYQRLGIANPNSLYYMAQCNRNLGKSYEAALIEAELLKKYKNSEAAKKIN